MGRADGNVILNFAINVWLFIFNFQLSIWPEVTSGQALFPLESGISVVVKFN